MTGPAKPAAPRPKRPRAPRKSTRKSPEQKRPDDRPVPIAPEYHLDTGLAEYGTWVRLFTEAVPLPDPGTFRRGRIWT
ncbi:hypothetical protein DPM19_30110 [Actinomadura craniellae]|uniref:Uncharacterized protein n=1 Tax=Actinomadura craniellae TaxID=2231787 RepID=A0A365GXR8_9ACTN|nr:hypothetical protein [Actinomadura craniellae]RAY11558.1 hypothetical protein DPM19_30110 [Actinomadura craniellae]